MTSAATMPIQTVTAPRVLQPLGDSSAAACEGDFCAIPDHHTQAVVNRKLDDDAV
ncbi:MAG: hypothetical protein ABJA94_11550 [Rhodoglobus sp.]